MKNKPFVAVNIVPTGIGASIGGFAGDAGPSNKLLASCVDWMVINPNVVNAATIQNLPSNVLYTEGYTLNRFFKEEVCLRPSFGKKIAVVFDQAIPEEVLNININAINACRSVYGFDIIGYSITDDIVGVRYEINADGISTGKIENTATLLKSCAKVIGLGAEAIAAVCFFPDINEEDMYAVGDSVDPIGGVEAIISHLISYHFEIPCAHAPAFSFESLLPDNNIVDPRAASEYFSPTFLPCVLVGLNQSPDIINIEKRGFHDLSLDDISVLISPAGSLGSVPVFLSMERNVNVITVKDNTSVLNIDADILGFKANVIAVSNYLEAAGVLMALKNNIALDTIIRPLEGVKVL